MSQENVDLVRRASASLGSDPARFDAANLTEFVSPEVEFDLSELYPDAPVVQGLDAVLRLRESLPWGDSMRMEPERFFDVGDERVLVFVHVTAAGEGSEVPVEMKNAHEYTIRDCVIVRMKVYADRTKAVEAAGLSE